MSVITILGLILVVVVLHKPLTILLGVLIMLCEKLFKVVKWLLHVLYVIVRSLVIVIAIPFIIIDRAGKAGKTKVNKGVVKRSVN